MPVFEFSRLGALLDGNVSIVYPFKIKLAHTKYKKTCLHCHKQ